MKKFQSRVHLSIVALVSFLLSFIAARTFTTLYPDHVLVGGGLHIHHFWFGIALLAIGGWLGISYDSKEINITAAILYGVGGGLIVDEVGLLLTFGNYWSGLTWAILIALLAFISVLLLTFRYREQILHELKEFITSKFGFTLAIFLTALSVAFITETDNLLVIAASTGLTIIALIILISYIFKRTKTGLRSKQI
jgi:hypothetical protein